MTHYTNSTTEHLEGYARARDIDIGVVISLENAAGRYFITREDGIILHRWRSLGWTVAEAKETIQRWGI